MIDLLINYSVISSDKKYIFPPNHAGPGGLTPLHLAASMSNSEDMIDALMNDPEEVIKSNCKLCYVGCLFLYNFFLISFFIDFNCQL